MAATRITIALDQATLECLNDLAEQLGKTKSEVARDAVRLYHQRHIDGVRGNEDQPTPNGPISPA
jgi:metal-responsive CopG/Arc/MetJ family transcriptional regulator